MKEILTMANKKNHYIHVNMQGKYHSFQGTARILDIKPHQLHAIMEKHDDFPSTQLEGYSRTYYDPEEVKQFLIDHHYINA